MGFDLNDLTKIGKSLLKNGVPLLGSSLLGPAAGKVLSLLGSNAESILNNTIEAQQFERLHQKELIALQLEETKVLMEATKDQLAFDTAQIQVGDKYVSRQRPTVIYIMTLILFVNLAVAPFIPAWTFVLPTAFYTLYGGSFLGYGYMRTAEKRGDDPIKEAIGKFIK